MGAEGLLNGVERRNECACGVRNPPWQCILELAAKNSFFETFFGLGVDLGSFYSVYGAEK